MTGLAVFLCLCVGDYDALAIRQYEFQVAATEF